MRLWMIFNCEADEKKFADSGERGQYGRIIIMQRVMSMQWTAVQAIPFQMSLKRNDNRTNSIT